MAPWRQKFWNSQKWLLPPAVTVTPAPPQGARPRHREPAPCMRTRICASRSASLLVYYKKVPPGGGFPEFLILLKWVPLGRSCAPKARRCTLASSIALDCASPAGVLYAAAQRFVGGRSCG